MTEQTLPQGVTAATISLALGHPDPTLLPVADLQRAALSVMNGAGGAAGLQYAPEQGTGALIDFLVSKINGDGSASLTADNLMIIAGSTHAVDMIARLLTPNKTVLVEAPTYKDALHIFHDHHIRLIPVAMDGDGIRIDDLTTTLERLQAEGLQPDWLYTIPNFHNPTGITATQARRETVLELAQRYAFRIVEDDVYRDLAFNGEMIPSYYDLTDGRDVLSVGSFSKTLGPGLRLGWLVAEPDIIDLFVNCGTSQMGGGASPFTAQMVAAYCHDGYWNDHIPYLRERYRHKCGVLLTALSDHMPAGVTWTQPEGGYFVWLTLPSPLTAQSVRAAAKSAGVLVTRGDDFFVGESVPQAHLRLTFSFAPPADLERGVQQLGDVMRSLA